jgi:hypothetical protein
MNVPLYRSRSDPQIVVAVTWEKCESLLKISL